MQVIVNNQAVELPDSSTIPDLFSSLNIESTKGLALAVNEQILLKESWPNYQLQTNDNILLIKATQGG